MEAVPHVHAYLHCVCTVMLSLGFQHVEYDIHHPLDITQFYAMQFKDVFMLQIDLKLWFFLRTGNAIRFARE